MLSFDDRITLIKYVIFSLSMFTLSFYKAPLKICREIYRNQNRFLRGGSEEKLRIHWIG